jgi:transcriptional regulator with XRE-family HTH domain
MLFLFESHTTYRRKAVDNSEWNPELIGERMRARMAELGMSQTELAAKLKVTPATLHHWLYAGHRFSEQTAMRLSEALGMPLGELVFGSKLSEMWPAPGSIKTAPRDGTRLLLWSGTEWVLAFHMHGRWFEEGQAIVEPTHWLPLPPDPKS